jgi:hypothetical protein
MQVLEIVITLKTQPRSQISFRILLLGRPSIAEEPKTVVAGLVGVLEVLPLRLPQDSGQMRSTAGPYTVNTRTRSSTVIPRAALAAHVGAGEEGVAVCYEVVGGALGGCRCADALG